MSSRDTAAALIARLGLEPHPEGGHYRETWRSEHTLDPPEYDGPRSAGTCIHYLLESGERSAPHRVRSDELWLWHAGDPMELTQQRRLEDPGATLTLGHDATFQALVPGGVWQSATPAPGPHGYALVSCVVVPGFDFQDFEMEPAT